jgi:hypothetical protein
MILILIQQLIDLQSFVEIEDFRKIIFSIMLCNGLIAVRFLGFQCVDSNCTAR